MHDAMRNTQYAVRVLLALAAILASGCQANNGSGTLVLNGVIEATQATVVAEAGGRVVEIAADEGDSVEMDQALVKLDDATFQVQVRKSVV